MPIGFLSLFSNCSARRGHRGLEVLCLFDWLSYGFQPSVELATNTPPGRARERPLAAPFSESG